MMKPRTAGVAGGRLYSLLFFEDSLEKIFASLDRAFPAGIILGSSRGGHVSSAL